MFPAANLMMIYFDSKAAALPLPVAVSVVGMELLSPTEVAPLLPVSQKEVPPVGYRKVSYLEQIWYIFRSKFRHRHRKEDKRAK